MDPIIVLDERKLSNFFDNISSGFQQSRLEILITVFLVLAFVVFLLYVYRAQKNRAHKEQTQKYRARYEQGVRKFGLGPAEQHIIALLAPFLNSPEKEYLLLYNQSTFNTCVHRLRHSTRHEHISEAALSALRVRLSFTAQDPEQVPSSSAELPAGMMVLVVSAAKRGQNSLKISGIVLQCTSQSLIISPMDTRAESIKPASGRPVKVFFQNRAGVFTFESHIQASPENTIHLAHSERIKRSQRRKYYRRRLSLPVYVRPAGSQSKPIKSVILDLGGGGASLRNPGEQFVPGDDLELILNPAGGGTPARAGRINLTAEVVRVSRKAQVLHVRFDGLQESTRDRIIGALFKAAAGTPTTGTPADRSTAETPATGTPAAGTPTTGTPADRSTPASFESKEK